MNKKDQGKEAHKIFGGNIQSLAGKLLYAESVELFSGLIKQHLPPSTYILADLGSHSGTFLKQIVEELTSYNFNTIAVDINESELKNNIAFQHITSDLSNLTSIKDKSVDVSISRYTLVWNSLEKQQLILNTIKRITSKIAIIQHLGADSLNPNGLQNASKKLFDGTISPLRRTEFFFSTEKDLESIMVNNKIVFTKVQSRMISPLSEIYKEKYSLCDTDMYLLNSILDNNDYAIQTTYVLFFD